MFDQNALNYLVDLGRDEEKVTLINEQPYSHLRLNRVELPSRTPVIVHTLDSLITFVKNIAETSVHGSGEVDVIHIENERTIKVLGGVREDYTRETLAVAEAELPSEIVYERFYDTETFNIMLQSRIVPNDDRDLLLRFTGLIKEENVRKTGDDGVAQAVTIKTGIATVGNAVVPNPVVIAPWRTFQEVAQPESQFIFRMKDGPSAALFEADGGSWRLAAIKNIKEYLEKELSDYTILA